MKQFFASSKRVIEWKSIEQSEKLQQMHKEELENNDDGQLGGHTRSLHEVKYLDVEPEVSKPPATSVMLESFMRDETPE